MFQDHAKKDRARFLRECPQEVVDTPSDERVKKAREYLGKNWVMHPEYVRRDHPDHAYPGSYHLREFMNKARLQGRI